MKEEVGVMRPANHEERDLAQTLTDSMQREPTLDDRLSASRRLMSGGLSCRAQSTVPCYGSSKKLRQGLRIFPQQRHHKIPHEKETGSSCRAPFMRSSVWRSQGCVPVNGQERREHPSLSLLTTGLVTFSFCYPYSGLLPYRSVTVIPVHRLQCMACWLPAFSSSPGYTCASKPPNAARCSFPRAAVLFGKLCVHVFTPGLMPSCVCHGLLGAVLTLSDRYNSEDDPKDSVP